MARRLCLSVFLPPKLFCLQEDLQHEANQGAVPVVSWPSSELGCLTGSCRDEASFLACLRLFHFWTPFFQRQSRLPPTATKTVRSNFSAIVENLLRSTASKLPAPGNKSNTGEDGCSYMAFGSKLSSQCWPRCAAPCLLLLWGALEGLGRLSSLEGEACPQAAGPDLFSRQGAGWDTVDSGSEEQAYVFSPATLSTLVRLHDTSGYSR